MQNSGWPTRSLGQTNLSNFRFGAESTLSTVIYPRTGRALLSASIGGAWKGFINWSKSWLLKQGRSQLCWYLNARGRKYLNTTADADPSKIGRWRDPRRDSTTKRRFERKLAEACETGLQHMSSPLSANQSKCESSRKGDWARPNSCWTVSIW